MAMPHTNGSQSFKLDNTYIKRQMIGQQSKRLNVTNDMVGTTTESPATIEGVNTTALIDTGSCVSTISRQFYESHLNHLELQKCEDILNIECANGDKLPYDGFIEASFTVQGLPIKGQHAIFLIVPNSAYNQRVPILLGTNILQELMKTCKDTFGERYLQNSSLSTPWYIAFSCLNVREKNLKKNKDKLAIICSNERQTILIKPNKTVTLKGYLTHKLDYQPTCAIMEATENSIIPNELEIMPTVINYDYKDNSTVDVTISNVTTMTIAVAPHSILCELQPATVKETFIEQDTEEEQNFENITIDTNALTEEQLGELKELLERNKDLFAQHENDIGHYTGVKHHITLSDETPFKQRYRRIPPAMIDEVRSHLEQLLSADIIRKSYSPFTSNVVLVRKKSTGKLRMCIDYRILNKRTVKDAYALPRIDDVLDTLSGAKYFTKLDMKSSYYQVEIEEVHKERTAFTVGPLGFYEFNRLPFGLCNSPATFQRIMETCLGDLNMQICVIYLDDLIVFSDTFEEHMERLELIFNRLRQYNLKLAPQKCVFCKTEVDYVGYTVSERGISADPQKIDKVRNWPTPKNPDDVRQFVGFAGFYRRFIKDFSTIVKPLNELMPSTHQKKKARPKTPDNWNWGERQENAFQELKEKLTSAPILAYSNSNLPYELHIDASGDALGAVLYQEQDGNMRVISYASRTLNKSEKNYPTMKLEFLALKWAATEKFADYLYGSKFSVVTDNNPLTYVLTTAKLDATGHRWIASLANFDFDIRYKPGKMNTDADALSRYPSTHVSMEDVKAMCKLDSGHPLITSCAMSSIDVMEATETVGQPMTQIEVWELRNEQKRDPILSIWMNAVKSKTMPPVHLISTKEHSCMKKIFHQFKLVRGVLYRQYRHNGDEKDQLVLPAVYIEKVLNAVHNEMGHPGRDRTLSILKDRFFWPGMTVDVDYWIKKCDRCLKRKSSVNIRAPLVNITTNYPLEMVCLDYLSLEPSKGGITNILVITDHFTKFAMAIPTRNQTAKTTAEAFYNNFILHYGIPAKIHTDQGANFESQLIKELCDTLGIEKSRTSAYHPMSNGIAERFNRTLISMIGTLENEKKRDWKTHLPSLVHAYNATRHETTGFSPFELLFGRTPKLPVDLLFGTNSTVHENSNSAEYITELRNKLQEAFKVAKDHSDVSRNKQKEHFDTKANACKLQIGDEVLVKKLALEGKKKLEDRFEEETFTVIEKPNEEIPVYKVKSASGNVKTLHRNHLLPVKSHRPPPQTIPTVKSQRTPLQNTLPVNPERTPLPNIDKPVPTPRKSRSGKKSTEERKSRTKDTDQEDTHQENTEQDMTEPEITDQDDEDEETELEMEVELLQGKDLAEPPPVQRVLPPPVLPRRSSRVRRKPQRFDVYNMKQTVPDNKVDTVKKLLNSGCLLNMSKQCVNELLETILN